MAPPNSTMSICPQNIRATMKTKPRHELIHNGGDGSEEGVAKPDYEHSVFLSECLTATDALAISSAYAFACPKLKQAANERHHGKTEKIP